MIFQPRELITLGIFSVIIIAINMMINMLSIFSPFLIPITKSLAGMIAGIPFMLYLARVKQQGAICLLALVLAAAAVLTGDHVLTLATALAAGAIAGIICSAAKKGQRHYLMILGYGIFNLWSVGGLLPIVFMRQQIEAQVAQQLGQEYADSFSALFSVKVIWLTLAGIFISGLLGAVIGLRVLNKHFGRAGFVQKNSW